jgi:HAD superfamily hydrolase (TIGR01509 family)
MHRLKVVLWDVDGTLAETERDGHRVAFNRAFSECGVPWFWDVDAYGRLLDVTGGYERLLFDMASREDAPVEAQERERLARLLHQVKNRHYAELVAAKEIELRPGVRRLMQECAAEGIALAIATTTGRKNVDSLLAHELGPDWESLFAAVACAEDAPVKKPDPSVYLVALERVGNAASAAVAIEDSPNGLQAAVRAGIRTVLTPSTYFRKGPFSAAALVVDNLDSAVSLRGREYERVEVRLLDELLESEPPSWPGARDQGMEAPSPTVSPSGTSSG